MKELHIGAGRQTVKSITFDGDTSFKNRVTLDINPAHNPDVVWDLHILPLPFADEEFDEIHAYEVLEHLATQGDYKFFFKEFNEYHRILTPGGRFFASVPAPNSPWAFGDPSHTRIFHPLWLTFLSQAQYEKQVGTTAMSDFRYLYTADFKTIFAEIKEETFFFVLEKI